MKDNKSLTLDEYKQIVEDLFRKNNPQYTEEQIKDWMTAPEEIWEQYMQDFTPEVMSHILDSGLV